MRALVLALVVLCGCPARAPLPALTPDPGAPAVVRYAWYDVSGASAAELRAAMNTLGPTTRADGRRFDAVTDWTISWRFDPQRTAGGCVPGPVRTTVTAVLRMPRWDPTDAPEDLAARWTAFIDALDLHEQGHVRIAEAGAAAVRERLPQVVRKRCPDTVEAANALGQAVVAETRKQQADYDRETRHGRTQGVRLD